jgi:hypothetical protein
MKWDNVKQVQNWHRTNCKNAYGASLAGPKLPSAQAVGKVQALARPLQALARPLQALASYHKTLASPCKPLQALQHTRAGRQAAEKEEVAEVPDDANGGAEWCQRRCRVVQVEVPGGASRDAGGCKWRDPVVATMEDVQVEAQVVVTVEEHTEGQVGVQATEGQVEGRAGV